MLGILLTSVSALALEVGCAFGKYTIGNHERRIYPLGVLINIGGVVLVLAFGLLLPKDFFAPGLPGGFVFSFASLPFFLPRIFFEILLAHTTLLALARAERSSFGFLRTLTLPLLLIVDLMLGYHIELNQLGGMALVIVGLLVLFLNHGIRAKGAYITLFTAVGAVINISLYKYDITHFNSVAAESGLIGLCVVAYFLVLSLLYVRQNPFTLLRERRYWVQFIASSVDHAAIGFAFIFAPASIIITVRRALGVLFAVISGELYFHEKHILLKLLSFVLVAGGLALLVQ